MYVGTTRIMRNYRVQEIVTPTGRVDTEDSILVVTDGDGHCAEVFASELG
jgi:hypothetical protein